jgi:hypothetical protein
MKWLALLPELVSRIPIERLFVRPPDNKKRLEELQEILEGPGYKNPQANRTPPEEKLESLGNLAEEVRASEDIATGCIPCAIGHFGTCAGLLSEAMRFAHREGLKSNEVIDRINKSLDELNTMERVDLDSEKIYDLPQDLKEIAVRALNASRSTRHALESITTVNELEKTTADVKTIRKDIGREWYNYRLANIPIEDTNDEAMEIADAESS